VRVGGEQQTLVFHARRHGETKDRVPGVSRPGTASVKEH
jgi:hypothetical protein